MTRRRSVPDTGQLGLDVWVGASDADRTPLVIGQWVAVTAPGAFATERGQVWADGAGAFVLVALTSGRAVELCTARTCRGRGCGRWHETAAPVTDALF